MEKLHNAHRNRSINYCSRIKLFIGANKKNASFDAWEKIRATDSLVSQNNRMPLDLERISKFYFWFGWRIFFLHFGGSKEFVVLKFFIFLYNHCQYNVHALINHCRLSTTPNWCSFFGNFFLSFLCALRFTKSLGFYSRLNSKSALSSSKTQ